MPGEPDPAYVLARRVLIDALEALGSQRKAVILVGAQAIYLHTGPARLAVAEFTFDGDLAIDPGALEPVPRLEHVLRTAGFEPDPRDVGRWVARVTGDPSREVRIDLLVPEALGGAGRRGARLGEHGRRTARKAKGLEGALVDRAPYRVEALEVEDPRSFVVQVAGPGALLVAKIHKIAERVEAQGRAVDKDALDVLRLLRATPTRVLADRLRVLASDQVSAGVTHEALDLLDELFARSDGRGSEMAARAATPLEDEATIRASCAALARDVLDALTD